MTSVPSIPFRSTTASIPLAANNCGLVGSIYSNAGFCLITSGGSTGPTGPTGSIGPTGPSGGPIGPQGPTGAINPTGTNWGDYLYWDSTVPAWAIGDTNITLGAFAGEIVQGLNAVALGYQAGQTNQGISSCESKIT